MAHISGANASVISGVTTIAGAHNWTLTADAEMLESTDYASAGKKEFISGNTAWTGSFDIKYDSTQDPHAVPPNVNEGQSIVFKFYITAAKYYEGTALISSVAVAAPQPDFVTYTASIQGTGLLDKSNL